MILWLIVLVAIFSGVLFGMWVKERIDILTGDNDNHSRRISEIYDEVEKLKNSRGEKSNKTEEVVNDLADRVYKLEHPESAEGGSEEENSDDAGGENDEDSG